jgi:hypothetical protein
MHGASAVRSIGFVTFRPMDVDQLSGSERCALFAKLRNKLGVYARGHGFHVTFVWSREVDLNGVAEHMHVLIHIPDRLHQHFEATVLRWLPERSDSGDYMTVVHVTPANQITKFTDHGKRYDAIGYLCKQMTTQAWYKRGMNRVAGGPIFGKRGGVTVNLGKKVIEAWEPSVKAPGRRSLGGPSSGHANKFPSRESHPSQLKN